MWTVCLVALQLGCWIMRLGCESASGDSQPGSDSPSNAAKPADQTEEPVDTTVKRRRDQLSPFGWRAYEKKGKPRRNNFDGISPLHPQLSL
ncbi:hypothetical protein HDV64DRAFT_190424 [Trichoderma sp. TUCIM 5745]